MHLLPSSAKHKKATIAEQLRADRFNEEQKIAARNIGNDDDYDNEENRR